MKRPAFHITVILSLFLPALAALAPSFAEASEGRQDDDPLKVHQRLYKKVAPAVCFVRGGGQSASGFFIDSDGIIVTTSTVATRDTVTVQTPGHKRYTGKVIGRLPKLELALVKVPGKNHPTLKLGNSSRTRVGQLVYALGDSFGSILTDDQVAISVGIISGKYELKKQNSRNTYIGSVLETSAAVNQNQDGGPLVDKHGRVIGMMTLNYIKNKFTGVAIPIDKLKDGIEELLAKYRGEVPPPKTGIAGWYGLRVREVDNGLLITRVSYKGPASKAGLKKGDIITRIDNRKMLRISSLKRLEKATAPGITVTVRILRDGDARRIKLTSERKKTY